MNGIIALFLLGITGGLCLAAGQYPTAKADLKAAYDALEPTSRTDKLLHDNPEPGNLAWGESYRLLSYVTAYEATGDARYLDLFCARFTLVLALRDDKTGQQDAGRGRVMKAWGTKGYTGGEWFCWLAHAGMIAYPAARFVRIVNADDKLAAYRPQADAFLAAVRETVAEFDADWRTGPGPDEGHYTNGPRGDGLPLNMQNALGCILLDLAAVTGDNAYLDKATRLAQYFKARLKKREDGAFTWEYWPGNGGSEDISHAGINLLFAQRAYEDHVVFTREDMTAFTLTFTKVVAKPDAEFTDTVGGDMLAPENHEMYRRQIMRWAGLTAFDPAVGDAISAYYWPDGKPRGGGDTDLLGLALLMKYRK